MKVLLEWIQNNKGLFTGIVIGLAIAVLFLTIGFWATLLIALCVGAGAFFGANEYARVFVKEWFKHIFAKKS